MLQAGRWQNKRGILVNRLGFFWWFNLWCGSLRYLKVKRTTDGSWQTHLFNYNIFHRVEKCIVCRCRLKYCTASETVNWRRSVCYELEFRRCLPVLLTQLRDNTDLHIAILKHSLHKVLFNRITLQIIVRLRCILLIIKNVVLSIQSINRFRLCFCST